MWIWIHWAQVYYHVHLNCVISTMLHTWKINRPYSVPYGSKDQVYMQLTTFCTQLLKIARYFWMLHVNFDFLHATFENCTGLLKVACKFRLFACNFQKLHGTFEICMELSKSTRIFGKLHASFYFLHETFNFLHATFINMFSPTLKVACNFDKVVSEILILHETFLNVGSSVA